MDCIALYRCLLTPGNVDETAVTHANMSGKRCNVLSLTLYPSEGVLTCCLLRHVEAMSSTLIISTATSPILVITTCACYVQDSESHINIASIGFGYIRIHNLHLLTDFSSVETTAAQPGRAALGGRVCFSLADRCRPNYTVIMKISIYSVEISSPIGTISNSEVVNLQ